MNLSMQSLERLVIAMCSLWLLTLLALGFSLVGMIRAQHDLSNLMRWLDWHC